MKAQLLGARRQLERTGWVGPDKEPWCRDARGRRVHHSDEGVYLVSVLGALQQHGPLEPALGLLGRIVSPALARLHDFIEAYLPPAELDWVPELSEPFRWRDRGRWVDVAGEEQLEQLQRAADGEFLTFGGWLTQAGRSREDVLRVFTTAVLRSNREKRT